MKRLVLIFASIFIAVLFGGYLWWAINSASVDQLRWLSLDPAKVVSLKMEKGSTGFACIRNESGWDIRVTSAKGDALLRTVPDSVNRLLKSIADIKPLRSFLVYGEVEQELYGLINPLLRFTLSLSEGGADKREPVIISFGMQKSSGRVFAWNSVTPGAVFELPQNVVPQLNEPAEKYYDMRLFSFIDSEVERLQLVQPFGSNWLVEKRSDGFVFLLPGYLKERPASASQIEMYIHTLINIKADALDPDAPVSGGETLTVRVWVKGRSTPLELAFFASGEPLDYLVGRSTWQPVPFRLDTESVGQLTQSVFDIQGRHILKLDTGKVMAVRLVNANQVFQLERMDNGWRDTGSKSEVLGIDMSLWRFTELQFESLPLKTLPDGAAWLMSCKLMDAGGEGLADLAFYADPNLPPGQSWLQNRGGMFYPVSSKLVQDLQGLFPVRSEEKGN